MYVNLATGIATFEVGPTGEAAKTPDYYSLQVMKHGASALCRRDGDETEYDEANILRLEDLQTKITQSTESVTEGEVLQINLDELDVATASMVMGSMMLVKNEDFNKMKEDVDLDDNDERWHEIHDDIHALVDFANTRNESWLV